MKKIIFGFTLIELLVVMAILGILASTLVVAVNPGRQLARARDTQRETDIYGILSAIYQYASEHSGDYPDTDGDPVTSNFPTSATCIGTDAGCFDLAAAGDTDDTIVPDYLAEMPKDPKLVATGQPGTDADTGYTVYIDANNRLHGAATGETKTISITK